MLTLANLATSTSGVMLTILQFLVVLTIVVFVHEFGHFIVARWCGVTVKTFSIGFGKEIFGFTDRKGTRWRFAWIVEFPLFEATDEGRFVAAHHPFTSPNAADLERLESDPGSVRARAYDLVLNGNEIAGGSIRIHRSDVQARVFRALGLSDEDAQAKFGFLLEAFKYGPPPHGGIAAGVDRLAMLLCGADSLRDVIAFPKTQKGTDQMTEAPGPVSKRQLDELHIALKE